MKMEILALIPARGGKRALNGGRAGPIQDLLQRTLEDPLRVRPVGAALRNAGRGDRG